jgi:hypothetical protein
MNPSHTSIRQSVSPTTRATLAAVAADAGLLAYTLSAVGLSWASLAKAALVAMGSTQSGLLVAGLLAAATLPPAMAGAGIARAALGTEDDAVAPATPAPDDLPLARGTRVGVAAGTGAVVALLATLLVEATVGGGPVTLALRPVLAAFVGGSSPPSSVGATTAGVALGLLPPVVVGLVAGAWYRTHVAVPSLGDRLRILALVNAVPVGAGVATLLAVTVTIAVQDGLLGAVLYGAVLLSAGTLALLAVVPVVVGVPAVVGYAVGELVGAGVGPVCPEAA